MIFESRRQAVLGRRKRSAAQIEGETFYRSLSRPYKQRKRVLYENRFRTHLAIELWNYARLQQMLDPQFPLGAASKTSFAKFAYDLESFIDDLLGMAESLPVPPYDRKTTDLTLLVAGNMGARKNPLIRTFPIADIVKLIEAAYAKSCDDKSDAGIWSK